MNIYHLDKLFYVLFSLTLSYTKSLLVGDSLPVKINESFVPSERVFPLFPTGENYVWPWSTRPILWFPVDSFPPIFFYRGLSTLEAALLI